ncbi:MAG: hypothetical protein CL424_14475 [Acidimicrobiaceae bacterium]|nr:hypothetical protein [Acidimicrobiaceae bacterium]
MTSWWRAIVSYPPTWFAAAVLGLAVWAIVALFDPSGVLIGVLVALALLAALAWPLTMSATGTLTKLQFAIPRVEEVDPTELARLTAELEALHDAQPAEQLVALQQKRQSLINVLERRLDAGEITYSRYVATAQQVFNSALHNLREVAVAYESISTIDDAYIERRLVELADDQHDDESVLRERATLEQRRELRLLQLRKIAQLLAQNESALTALNRTTTALANVPIGQRPEDADAAMAALDELADRAAKYAV